MTRKTTQLEPTEAVYLEASEWLVDIRHGELDGDGQARFGQWLRRSPDHIRAYMEMAVLWSDIPSLTADMSVDVENLVASTRAGANVRQLGARQLEPAPSAAAISNKRPGRIAIGAGAIAAIVLLALGLWSVAAKDTYSTAIAQERLITLADGSAVQLHPRSRIRVHLDSRARHVELLSGQAMFDVAKDGTRPFTVSSRRTEIRALGTRFDVQQRPSSTTVTVIEGQVAITPNAHAPVSNGLQLVAGQQVVVPTMVAGALRPHTIDPQSFLTWAEHELNFQNQPLADVVEEFNRYNERQIVLDGSGLAAVRVSGVFSATRPDSLLEFLRQQMHLEVSASARVVHIRAPATK